MDRPLMLLDVVAGHGRENILHELEMGNADVCDPSPKVLVQCVLAALERAEDPVHQPSSAGPWSESLGKVLVEAGITPGVSIART
jgi:processive 1,2-diacylglycerol beta-glucosyltransferase